MSKLKVAIALQIIDTTDVRIQEVNVSC